MVCEWPLVRAVLGMQRYWGMSAKAKDYVTGLWHACFGLCFGATSKEQRQLLEPDRPPPGGSMACVLSEFGALEGKTLRKATLGMLEGLDFLHTRSVPVVHRDLKAGWARGHSLAGTENG